jgi:MYXO-CTERM domain-containing protein
MGHALAQEVLLARGMKRFSVAAAASTIVPAAVFFAIAARPARLYAEAGVALSCSAPEVTACAGQSANDPCLDGGAGTCQPAQCVDQDAGAFVPTLVCVPPAPCAPQARIDECNGQSLGAPCSVGACVPVSCPTADGGELLVCMNSGGQPLEAGAAADASPDGGGGAGDAGATSGGNGAGCSCDAAGGTRGGAGAAFGLLLALLALHRAQRRRS